LYNAAQLGHILNKGLDLAEAGMGLGVNLLSQFGSIVKGKFVDKIVSDALSGPAVSAAPRAPETNEQQAAEPGVGQRRQTADRFFLSNRLPVAPGGQVSLSFSVNNDSSVAMKKIGLRVEGFVGESSRHIMNGQSFSVKPAKKDIAPMDFDKFTLSGMVPVDAPDDSYHGWIIVSDQEEHKIPVFLIVSKKL